MNFYISLFYLYDNIPSINKPISGSACFSKQGNFELYKFAMFF